MKSFNISIRSTIKALFGCGLLLLLIHYGCKLALKNDWLNFLYLLWLFIYPLIFITFFLILLLIYKLVRYWWKRTD